MSTLRRSCCRSPWAAALGFLLGACSTGREQPSAPAAQPTAAEPPAEPAPISPDCELLKERAEAALVAAGRCSADADCMAFHPRCPFGCTRAVSRTADLAPVEAALARHEAACSRCVYRCSAEQRPLVCRAGSCQLGDAATAPPAATP